VSAFDSQSSVGCWTWLRSLFAICMSQIAPHLVIRHDGLDGVLLTRGGGATVATGRATGGSSTVATGAACSARKRCSASTWPGFRIVASVGRLAATLVA